MSLEGLRAWVAEVEHKLGKRTRVFLALSVIAIGIAGAAIYLAIDARDSSVSEGDVRALQEELEARIDALDGAAAAPLEPESEAEPAPAPKPQPAPEPSPPPQNGGSGGGGTGGGDTGGDVPDSSSGAAETAPKGAADDPKGKNARILELLEEAKKQNAEAEAEQKSK